METFEHLTDHELNEHFGERSVKKWGLKLYQGEFPTVDKTEPHYCPNCMDLDRPLRLIEQRDNPDEFILSCTEHHERCEYEYKTRGLRIKYWTSFGEHWRPPLTRPALLQHRIVNYQKGVESLKAKIEADTESLNALETKLSSYRKELEQLI